MQICKTKCFCICIYTYRERERADATMWMYRIPCWFIPHMLHVWLPGPSHRRLRASGHWHWRQAVEATVVSNGWIQRIYHTDPGFVWVWYGSRKNHGQLLRFFISTLGLIKKLVSWCEHEGSLHMVVKPMFRVIPIKQFHSLSFYFGGVGAENDGNSFFFLIHHYMVCGNPIISYYHLLSKIYFWY